MKEIRLTFRLTKKEETTLINNAKLNNQSISDFLRFLINQKKDIFNCKKEDLIFFQSRFPKLLNNGLSLNLILKEINTRFVKNKSIKISKNETESIKDYLSKIEIIIDEINQEFKNHKIVDLKNKNKENKKIVGALRLTEEEMYILSKYSSAENIDISKYIRYMILNLDREFSLSPNQIEEFLYEYEISSRLLSNITQVFSYLTKEKDLISFLEIKRKLINNFRHNITLFIKKYG